jgi:hypothetical protein
VRLELFSGGFNSARGYLIEVTPHLFFGAAELPQASLDLLNGRPAAPLRNPLPDPFSMPLD